MDMEQMPIFLLIDFVRAHPALAIPALLILLGLVIGYYVVMVRATIQMLRLDAHTVLIIFAFLSLFPFPLVIIAGILVLIIWRFYRPDLAARRASATPG